MTTTTTWLAVEPLDTIMVRDGRRFDAGGETTAAATAPSPTTFGGVVKAVVGRDVGYLVGPVPHIHDLPYFPAPVDLVREGDAVDGVRHHRLSVAERAHGEVTDLDPEDGSGGLTHVLAGKGEPVGGWIDGEGMAAWLSGRELPPGSIDDEEFDDEEVDGYLHPELWSPERHVGLALDPDGGTAVDGLLYSAEHLRPTRHLRFVVGCADAGPLKVPTGSVVPFGGQGRMAEVSRHNAAPFPAAPEDFPGGRLCVYLATPALVRDVRWRPEGTSARLCAMGVAGPQPVATATPGDIGRTSRLMWTVPAGSVYYLEFDTAEEAGQWSQRYHGRLLPGVSRNENPVVTAGFGTCLTGRW